MAAKNVVYRGEGITNLVLANFEDKKVYRLLKIGSQKTNNLLTKNNACEEERSRQIHHSLENVVSYVKNVMEPLLSSHFVSVPTIAQIPKGFVEKIEAEIQHVRPAHRKINQNNFQTVDPATCSALVLPDLCFLRSTADLYADKDRHPTISVEIKPKKGFLPLASRLPKECAIKSSVCKFCLHKCLKGKCGRWTEWSQYCPIDLFSGDRQRMKHALLCQYNTPQNNLKIFQNGKEVFSELVQEDLSSILNNFFGDTVNGLKNGLRKQQELHILLELIIDALLATPVKGDNFSHEESQNQESGQKIQLKDYLLSQSTKENQDILKDDLVNGSLKTVPQRCDRSCFDAKQGLEDSTSLPVGCVLERILYTQQFDTDDVEGVWPLYQKIKEHFTLHPEDCCKLCMTGPYTHDSWLKPCLQGLGSSDTESLDYAVNMVKRFLVSRTMQDCSIMIAFQKLPPESSDFENDWRCLTDSYGRKFISSINIIDFDPKPFDKLQKYEKLEKNILETYKEQHG